MTEQQIERIYSDFFADSDGITNTDVKFVKFIINEYIEDLFWSAAFHEAAMDYRGAGPLQAQDAYVRMFDVMKGIG